MRSRSRALSALCICNRGSTPDLGRLVDHLETFFVGPLASPEEMERSSSSRPAPRPAQDTRRSGGLHDVGFGDDRVPYVVMEYVQGQSLAEGCARNGCRSTGPPSWPRRICRGVYTLPTSKVSSTATSSRPTSCWTKAGPTAHRRFRTGRSRRRAAAERGRPVGHAAPYLSARRAGPRRNASPRRPRRRLVAGRDAVPDVSTGRQPFSGDPATAL